MHVQPAILPRTGHRGGVRTKITDEWTAKHARRERSPPRHKPLPADRVRHRAAAMAERRRVRGPSGRGRTGRCSCPTGPCPTGSAPAPRPRRQRSAPATGPGRVSRPPVAPTPVPAPGAVRAARRVGALRPCPRRPWVGEVGARSLPYPGSYRKRSEKWHVQGSIKYTFSCTLEVQEKARPVVVHRPSQRKPTPQAEGVSDERAYDRTDQPIHA